MKVFISFFAIALIGALILASLFYVKNAQISESVSRGQTLYGENCASCHGVNLEGQPDWRNPNDDGILPAPPHSVDGHTWHHDDFLLFEYTKFGGAGAMASRGIENFNSGMPPFEDVLSDSEINDIWAYIKSTWTDLERDAQNERTALFIDANQ